MGLLSKADRASIDTQPAADLDQMGKALRDRIRRLPPKKTAPYTALSLMKAYSSFQAGICLSLRKGVYTSYASVGLGIEKINIDAEKLYTPQNASSKYFKLDQSETLGVKYLDSDISIWIFPLDKEHPWGAVLLLGADGASLFNPEPIAIILEGIQDIINPQIDKIIQRDSKFSAERSSASKTDEIEATIKQYHKTNPAFSGILVELPKTINEEDKKGVPLKISHMVSLFGIAAPFPSNHSLILIPRQADRDLIAHRLKNSLKTNILAAFDADSPEEALKTLQPFL
ncbi:hypothetical protein [Leadbettera azotonutricia]|uniref:Uncharacterized protein n=1 Tax=Leadbettera azotonutricia (strain ATCC BAA-888 / DSM 13862 / ZAS-9) TaxID=545695 RepID=F5YCW4_LEAAZ|nr:hypothetical protein [Leadbettera azotonutricia]AEF83299.1 hypothetical protein TREAZ_0410 [Leadbettera azotonutricia ZAS-9]